MVFVAVEAFALALWMAAGRYLWFYLDDWDFLAARRSGDIGDLFRPHNEHWTTVPILIYRVLFHMYGLQSYTPYRFVGVVVYLALAALLFVLMRRVGVHPWIATVIASRFALFGAGAQNIVRPFQLTFNGALAFGLLHLLLADHDGPFDRRDRFGLAAGFVGLMMSGVAVPMVIAVGITVLWRRGWRMALLHTAPLGACYTLWWLVIGHTGSVLKLGPQAPVTISGVYGFVESGLRGSFSGLGHVKGFGIVLAVLFVIGLPFAWIVRRGPRRDDASLPPVVAALRAGRRAELGAPVGLVVAAIVFLAITALGRSSFGSEYARIGRYVSITSAMLVPALGVAVDAIVARRRVLLIAGLVILVLGFQPNLVDNFGPHDEFLQGDAATRIMMLTIPRDPVALHVPRSLHPETVLARPVTIGWLLDSFGQHRIPAPRRITKAQLTSNRFRMSFDQEHADAPTTNCQIVRATVFMSLAKGDVIGLSENALFVVPENRASLAGYPLRFLPSAGRAIFVVRKTGVVRFVPATPPYWPKVCVVHAPDARTPAP